MTTNPWDLSLTEQAAIVEEYLETIGNPGVTAVTLATYPEAKLNVVLRDATSEVPWPEPDSDGYGTVRVEFGGATLRISTMNLPVGVAA